MINHYCTQDSSYKGRPYIEIRRNGGPFFTFAGPKQKFQFGRYKALMLLTCMRQIEEFAWSKGTSPEFHRPIVVSSDQYMLRCTCVRYDSFETSCGFYVRQPYLRIESEGTIIGLGVQKAIAILELQSDIESFVAASS